MPIDNRRNKLRCSFRRPIVHLSTIAHQTRTEPCDGSRFMSFSGAREPNIEQTAMRRPESTKPAKPQVAAASRHVCGRVMHKNKTNARDREHQPPEIAAPR